MTESFEDAMVYAQAIMADCDVPILDHLQKAHDHEMEQLRRARFREGYEAGQRSMDAEHYQLKLRLQGLRFGDGSHENLSRLAYAIYPCPTGWGKESCEGVRDKLIELLGGVHDEPAPIPASGCACDADCDCGHGDETAVAYDVLGNERYKAVCELRKLPDWYWYTHDGKQSPAGKFKDALSDAIGVMGLPSFAKIRDRLIHLLGGDEPTAMEYIQRIVREHDIKCLDMEPSCTDEPDSQESPILSNCDTEDGGEITITDELRKWASDRHCKGISHTDVLNIGLIADRIDERFNHAMISRSSELGCYKLRINQLEQERDELQKKLDKVMKEANRHRWEYCETCEVSKTCDELRKSLRKIAERVGVPHEVDLDEYSDDLVVKATLAKIDGTHEYVGALEYQRDRQKKLLDEYDQTHMKLPVDANGESVHVGDIMEYAEGGKPKEVIAVSDTEVFLVDDGPRYSSLCVHHVPVDTAESIVRDIHLGKVTDTQAIERIWALP